MAAKRKNPKRVAAGKKAARARWKGHKKKKTTKKKKSTKKRTTKKRRKIGKTAKRRVTASKKTQRKRAAKKGQIPLYVLEKRLKKLNNTVKRRGGDYCDYD